ncbi:MAG: uL15 family ribosomal protein, partial [Minisyncoccales bacterium]
KKGTYCGRGIKGQKARSGKKLKPIVREILKKYPKLRGYRFKPTGKDYEILNLEILEKKFKEGETITPQLLKEKNIIKRGKRIKVLAKGEIKKKFIFQGLLFSKRAKEKILKQGGKIL